MKAQDIANNLFQAIDEIVEVRLQALQFNSTIIATVEKSENNIYTVNYQSNLIQAFPLMGETYERGESVYVLILSNSWDTDDKNLIIASVDKTKKPATTEGAVRYDCAQTLTAEQQRQAQQNIGILEGDEVSY